MDSNVLFALIHNNNTPPLKDPYYTIHTKLSLWQSIFTAITTNNV